MRIQSLLNKDKNLTRLLGVFLVILLFACFSQFENFVTVGTFRSMGQLLPEYGILAIGMSLALLTGGIDLSVVFVADFCAILVALVYPQFVNENTPMGTAVLVALACILVALLVGALWGCVNGLLIAAVGIPPILATLGTQRLINGLSVILTGGSTLSGVPAQFTEMINQRIVGIPLPFILFLACAVIVGLVISKTTLGYKIRMLGTNVKACTYSGMSVVKLTVTNYAIIGALSAVAGIIMLGMKASAKADYGSSYTMQAIMIAVMGGVAPSGGKGNVQGVVVAVFIIQIISTWLGIFRDLNNLYRQIIWGALLIIVLIVNYAVNQRETKRSMQQSKP